MLEVMIAVSLLAGLTVIVWVSIGNMFQVRDHVKDRYERYQIMRVALDRMASEIASAYVAGPAHGAEDLYSEQAQNQQDAEDQQAISQREPVEFGMRGRDDRLAFTSFAHMRTVEGERASHHAEIAYYITETQEDGESVDSLVRREDTTVDDDITQGGKVYTLIPNVDEIEFEYWDAGEVDIGTEEEMAEGRWVGEWDTSDKEFHDRLPFRVRITVTLPPQGPFGTEETFSTQTQIMTHQMLDL